MGLIILRIGGNGRAKGLRCFRRRAGGEQVEPALREGFGIGRRWSEPWLSLG